MIGSSLVASLPISNGCTAPSAGVTPDPCLMVYIAPGQFQWVQAGTEILFFVAGSLIAVGVLLGVALLFRDRT